jgi:predicted nucleic acid-binding protein
MRLYLDANAIVFTVEGPDPLREAVAVWLDRAEAAANGAILTSRLSRIECLTKSLRERDGARFEAMDCFFTGGGIEILSLDDGLVDIATDLQRDFSLRTIDALHVATAIHAKADVFLTRDAGIARYATIRSVRIERIS